MVGDCFQKRARGDILSVETVHAGRSIELKKGAAFILSHRKEGRHLRQRRGRG